MGIYFAALSFFIGLCLTLDWLVWMRYGKRGIFK